MQSPVGFPSPFVCSHRACCAQAQVPSARLVLHDIFRAKFNMNLVLRSRGHRQRRRQGAKRTADCASSPAPLVVSCCKVVARTQCTRSGRPEGVDSYCLRLGRSQPASLHRRWLKERARRLPAATLYHTGGWAQHPATDGALSNHRRFITHFIMCSLRYVVAAGKRLLSPQGDVTRPMMEMVRSPSVPTPCVVLP